jgi:Rrf2 family iron-sulfur cluster assembly transcriptional regulator
MLSVTVQHALRALSVLAGLPAGASLLGKDLAKRANIPANYLSKILWILGGAGFIGATRGSGGGYRLQRPASQVRLADIVVLFEHSRSSQSCFLDDHRQCSPAEPCAAHLAWHKLDSDMTHFLETTTLADITAEKDRADRG